VVTAPPEIETLPVIGSVVLVETYTFQGVVACVTPIGTFVTLTGKVTDVETYVFQGTVPCKVVTAPLTETEPVTGNVALVDTYVCTGCGIDVTETLPVIGKVADVLT